MIESLFTQGANWYTGGIHWTAIWCWGLGALVFYIGRVWQIGGAVPSFLAAALIYTLATKALQGRRQPAAASGSKEI